MLAVALFGSSLVSLVLVLGGAAFIVRQQRLRPAFRLILSVLLWITILLGVLHTTTWRDQDVVSGLYNVSTFWDWVFDLGEEMTAGSYFASLLYVLVAQVAFGNGWRVRCYAMGQRLYWWFLAAVFLFLALDEFFSFHEIFFQRIAENAGIPYGWRTPYVVAGTVVMFISLGVFRFYYREDKATFSLFLLGYFMMGMSGVILERLMWNAVCPVGFYRCWTRFEIFEEFFEMVGLLIMLAGLLVFAHHYFSANSLQRVPRRLLVGSVLWMLLLWAYMVVLPVVEMHTFAEPVSIEYLDGKLTLIGYRLPEEPVRPGEEIIVTYYWRTNAFIPQNYNLSSRLLYKPTGDLLTQHDLLWSGPPPVVAWMPGTTIRVRNRITLPEDMPVAGSYWLMTRLWSGPADASVGLPVTNTAEWLITPDGVVVDSLAVLSEDEVFLGPAVASYRFADNLWLQSYDFPDALVAGAGELPIMLWWRTESAPGRDLTQFFHVFQGDEFITGYDQPLFAGAFPTSDWPDGISVQDTVIMPLPDDLPPGDYQMVTGLYDPATVDRLPVVDHNTALQPDGLVQLGAFTITE